MSRRKYALGILALMVFFSVRSEQLLDSGRFFFQIEGDVGVEGFQWARLDDGNLKLTSEFQALSETLVLDFGTDKLFTQEIVLTPELKLVSYLLDSDTERGKFHVEVKVEDSVATIEFEVERQGGDKEQGQRDVILEDNVLTTGIAASQFFLMQKFIDERLDLEKEPEITLTAFDPTDINEPLVELVIKRLNPVLLEDSATKQQFKARRVEVRQEEFRAELLSCAEALGPCQEAGKFLGFVSSTATLAGVKLKDAPGGVLVEEVASGSFAEQAGLRAGDLITHVDGQRVDDRFELRSLLQFKDPTSLVTLTIQRGGQILELEVRLSGSRLLVYRFDLFPAGFAILGEAK